MEIRWRIGCEGGRGKVTTCEGKTKVALCGGATQLRREEGGGRCNSIR